MSILLIAEGHELIDPEDVDKVLFLITNHDREK